jgi:hypothetical protein
MGYWIMLRTRVDRLAFPMRIGRIALYGPPPRAGARLRCTVRVADLGEQDVRADLDLVQDARVWCRIDGWVDRRFDTDDAVWPLLRFPERHVLGDRLPGGEGHRVRRPWRGPASRDLLARRYLGEGEHAAYEALPPRDKGPWLLGRIAVKDAVRAWLFGRGHGALFPVEVVVTGAAGGDGGDIVARGPFEGARRVSLVQDEEQATARLLAEDEG